MCTGDVAVNASLSVLLHSALILVCLLINEMILRDLSFVRVGQLPSLFRINNRQFREAGPYCLAI